MIKFIKSFLWYYNHKHYVRCAFDVHSRMINRKEIITVLENNDDGSKTEITYKLHKVSEVKNVK